ncbi:hypothetical protein OSTOST_04136 [Ostertagia ostertagi]
MGAESSSSAKKPEIVSLTKEQVRRATELLKKHVSGKEFLNKHQFQEIYSELQPITSLLFDVVEDGGRCSFSNLLLLADGLLGDASSQSATLLRLFGTTGKALERIVSVYANRNGLSDSDSSALLEYLMHEAPTEARFDRWLLGHSLAAQLVLHVFAPLIFEKGPSLHPSTPCESSLLTHSAVMVINMHLPSERRKHWSLLFSSSLHGSSFSQMTKRINEEGPCIVVVNSSNGSIFGCFASEGFLMGPNYHGDATSFLFEVKPQLRIFSATGMTNDYAYLNVQQVSLPNGLGMGGHETVWPFFIDEDYGTGTSMANISSFEKCHLAGSDHFEISNLEVWRVGDKPPMPFGDEIKRSEKSIIDKDPEAVALLELSGRTMHSEAYREPAPLLDEPFEL